VSGMFERWTCVSELWNAARRAARGKRHRESVARTLLDLEPTVLRLSDELRAGTWRPGRATAHAIRDPKARTIVAAPFVDRIVHQALCHAVGPLLDRGLIGDTYACRVGLGTHAALRRATRWARTYRFALHLDVRKFFPSIDQDILLAQLGREVPCERTLEVCRAILSAGADRITPVRFHFAGDDLFAPLSRAVGLPIGNLTSQHFANRYLSPVDHRAKDRLRLRPYLRYMDDMLLFGDDRERLHDAGHAIEEACARLRLRLHPWQVIPTRAGVGFLGFRVLPEAVRVKRSSVARAQKRLRERLAAAQGSPEAMAGLLASLRSTFAHWEHADSWRLREKTLRDLGLLAGAEKNMQEDD
jgi:RNA-directed DNA polymerase